MTRRRQSDQETIDAATLRSLPHNLEAEKSVLGAIVVHNDAFELVTDLLTSKHFYRDGHRRIYEALERLLARRVAVDFVTLKEELARTGELDDVGGSTYIAGLADGMPRSTNVKHYASIVREKAMLREIVYAANKAITSAYTAEDAADVILQQADRAFLDIEARGGRSRMATLKGGMKETFARIEDRHDHRHELLGIDTGFQSINDELLGWQPGELVILAARPSIGKTAFFMNSIITAASGPQQVRVAVFSLEMRRAQLENRILSILSGIDAHRIRSGHLGSKDFEQLGPALNAMGELPISIDDRSGQNALEMRAACRRLKADSGLDLVVIDYVQLMPGCIQERNTNRNEQVTDTANRLKDLSDELTVPIILVSQLTRANTKRDDPRPRMSDLRESGALEQVADVITFLHRKNHKAGGFTEFIIDKQRNGPTGTVELGFDRDTQRFSQWVGPRPEEETKKPKGKVSSPGYQVGLPVEHELTSERELRAQ